MTQSERVSTERPRSSGAAKTVAVWFASYLYGSVPVVYFLGRLRHVDLTTTGSRNVGGANLWSAVGARLGVIGWIFDTSKGFLPVLICRRLGFSERTARIAGICGGAGQSWPIFLRFNGGRGISGWIGVNAATDRRSGVLALLPFAGGGLWRVIPLLARGRGSMTATLRGSRSKSVPLGCFLGILALPVLRLVTDTDEERDAGTALLHAAVLLLRRLTAPLPDDAEHGPSTDRSAFLYRLLYDRNTSN